MRLGNLPGSRTVPLYHRAMYHFDALSIPAWRAVPPTRYSQGFVCMNAGDAVLAGIPAMMRGAARARLHRRGDR